MNTLIDITGQRFGRLVVEQRLPSDPKDGKAMWLCKCDCGNAVVAKGKLLRNGHVTSCGCYKRDLVVNRSTRHNGSRVGNTERLYYVWKGMKRRCFNPSPRDCDSYEGVTVCDEWLHDYGAFREWSYANGYDDTTPLNKHTCTLDRINPYGNYEPSNCRWADAKTQALNTRKNWKGVSNGYEYDAL